MLELSLGRGVLVPEYRAPSKMSIISATPLQQSQDGERGKGKDRNRRKSFF